uniref:Uncharacterized protein n=1 Tax=Parascaris univalens TaxID=6257 RepID=A0A915AHE5_PARUN
MAGMVRTSSCTLLAIVFVRLAMISSWSSLTLQL